ncbi:MAG: adenosylcobinamide-phosphate synthase CbiB [Vulcanimicrobiaceae bacterium]
MTSARALALACAADAVFGDPAGFPHPVRGIGALCAGAEILARAYARGDASRERTAGVVLCATLVGGTYGISAAALAQARRVNPRFGSAVEIALAWTTLAARDLLAEASAVTAALEAHDVARARSRLGRIVGRDTGELELAEMTRATIETLAESACDGIVAPLLALAVGGVPLALAFKAANTLDSMLGHLEAPYTHLGWAAARLDDVACYVPARVTALALVLCAPCVGGDAKRAIAVLRADGHRHRSPNAGRPEAAMAGALGVRLGGTNFYDGVPFAAPLLGAQFLPPAVDAARQAAWLVAISACVMAALAYAVLSRCGLRPRHGES